MNVKKLALATLILVLLSHNICFGFDDEGFQFWTGTSLSAKLDERTKFTFTEEFRFGNDGGNLYRHHSDFGLLYMSFLDNVDLGFNYMQIFEKDGNDEWRQEHRPHLNLKVRGKLFGLNVANRSRFEFRDRENKDNLWRYRHKFTINRPFEFLDSDAVQKLRERYKLYVADEVFFDCDGNGYARNRLYSGVLINLADNIAGDLYFLWQSDEDNGGTKDIHVLGFKLIISF